MGKKKPKADQPQEDTSFWVVATGADGVQYRYQDGVEQYGDYVESLRLSETPHEKELREREEEWQSLLSKKAGGKEG